MVVKESIVLAVGQKFRTMGMMGGQHIWRWDCGMRRFHPYINTGCTKRCDSQCDGSNAVGAARGRLPESYRNKYRDHPTTNDRSPPVENSKAKGKTCKWPYWPLQGWWPQYGKSSL